VSILFADLAGFTSFSEGRDPTEVAAMLNTYFGHLIPLMERVGGDVHQITGDELMVVFGKGDESSDHPARAARAGLLLQQEADRIARDHADWPRFRVGVNSGEVHAGLVGGSRGHRKHGFVGDVVNLTARLQAEAPVGGVLIGEGTFRRLGARAQVEPLPPLHVKGKEAPVAAYLLHRVEKERPLRP
jgi:class 3 adenylate cyclase